MKIPSTILAAAIVVLLFSGPSASAKDNDIVLLQGDVVKLQQTVQKLQDAVDAKNATMISQMEKIADAVNNLTTGLQKINEQIGTIRSDSAAANAATTSNLTRSANDTRDALAPISRQISDLQSSLKTLNETVTGIRTQQTSLNEQIVAMKATTSNLPTCKDLKQDADRSALSHYWAEAVTGYRDFMAQCMSDPMAPEVQFSIADSLYNMGKFDQAILDYDIFLKNYPTNDKTPSALLRKGLAHAEQKQITDARAAWTRITMEFKNTSEYATAVSLLKQYPAVPAGRGGRGN